jgi:hypothetical protein
MAQPQLALVETEVSSWRLDERTKEVGRRGVAQARAALSAAIRRREAADQPTEEDPVEPGHAA